MDSEIYTTRDTYKHLVYNIIYTIYTFTKAKLIVLVEIKKKL